MYSQIALSIETLLDLSTLSVEEVTGRLKAVEDRLPTSTSKGADGKLLLSEEQWIERMKAQKQGEGSSSSPKSGHRRRKQTQRSLTPGALALVRMDRHLARVVTCQRTSVTIAARWAIGPKTAAASRRGPNRPT